jgi:hypothetical protein
MGNQFQYGNQQGHTGNEMHDKSGKTFAIVALVLGLIALIVPIAYIDVVAGVMALIFVGVSKKKNFSGGLWTAALVIGIIGTIASIVFTLDAMGFGLLSEHPWFN